MTEQYRTQGRTAREIADSVEAGVRHGRLLPGDLLPSVRTLAADLGISPNTAASAYSILRERGVVETAGRRGTSIRSTSFQRSGPGQRQPVPPGVVDLSTGSPDLRLLPDLRPHLRAIDTSRLSYVEAGPEPALRQMALRRLAADGLESDALGVTSGALDGIRLCLDVTLQPGDLVAVEDPGWTRLLDLIPAMGLRIAPVTVDEGGPVPSAMESALRAGARAVIVTSRAHNPTGVSLGRSRAEQLRTVLAARPPALVIEDDHAAELSSRPMAGLATGAAPSVLIRSAAKPFGPDLRLALLSGDDATVDKVARRQWLGAGWVSWLLQRLLVSLWEDPAVTMLLNSAKRSYADRREGLIEELAKADVTAHGDDGLNVWVPVHDETAVVTALLADGWLVAPGGWFRIHSVPGVRISIGQLEPAMIPELARAVVGATRRSSAAPPV